MREDLERIGAWAVASFGRMRDLSVGGERVNEEMAELLRAAARNDRDSVLEEAADIVITLAHLAASFDADLGKVIDTKMDVNRARNWRLRGDGTASHIPSDPGEE